MEAFSIKHVKSTIVTSINTYSSFEEEKFSFDCLKTKTRPEPRVSVLIAVWFWRTPQVDLVHKNTCLILVNIVIEELDIPYNGEA